MTREEMYASIYSHDTVYRPPQEEGSAMLEVALGCSWGKSVLGKITEGAFSPAAPQGYLQHGAALLLGRAVDGVMGINGGIHLFSGHRCTSFLRAAAAEQLPAILFFAALAQIFHGLSLWDHYSMERGKISTPKKNGKFT